ncbi:hypothetical protein CPB86DRAFT_720031, partial [Serendipita vermifera]
PTKSELRPPKQAPSMWQIYFADWLQDHKTRHPHDKLNVAQAAKEAGQLYKTLDEEMKEDLKRRVYLEKEVHERRLQAWQRTLTPEDIKRENRFRAAEHKAGLSSPANIKDPNAPKPPKKPLSAYFLFITRIRSDPALFQEVFGDEMEVTRQSVLAARRWREMSDEEKEPFLTQAKYGKIQYEALRKIYEEQVAGPSGSDSPHSANHNKDNTSFRRKEALQAYPIRSFLDQTKVIKDFAAGGVSFGVESAAWTPTLYPQETDFYEDIPADFLSKFSQIII